MNSILNLSILSVFILVCTSSCFNKQIEYENNSYHGLEFENYKNYYDYIVNDSIRIRKVINSLSDIENINVNIYTSDTIYNLETQFFARDIVLLENPNYQSYEELDSLVKVETKKSIATMQKYKKYVIPDLNKLNVGTTYNFLLIFSGLYENKLIGELLLLRETTENVIFPFWKGDAVKYLFVLDQEKNIDTVLVRRFRYN